MGIGPTDRDELVGLDPASGSRLLDAVKELRRSTPSSLR
jgi:hypothetical protein